MNGRRRRRRPAPAAAAACAPRRRRSSSPRRREEHRNRSSRLSCRGRRRPSQLYPPTAMQAPATTSGQAAADTRTATQPRANEHNSQRPRRPVRSWAAAQGGERASARRDQQRRPVSGSSSQPWRLPPISFRRSSRVRTSLQRFFCSSCSSLSSGRRSVVLPPRRKGQWRRRMTASPRLLAA